MNYIVFDLEWNQSNTTKAKENKKLHFEIVELGAIKLNDDCVTIGEFNQLVKPQVYHEMHHITGQLIHIQMQELEKGKPFPEMMEEFLDWCGDEPYMFCTWGSLDLTELQRNMKFYGMTPLSDGPIAFLDLQKLFSIAFEDGKSRRSLEYAIDFLNIEKDIPFHRAFSDAYYTAKVMAAIPDKELRKRVSFDIFSPPKRREDEIKVQFDDYMKYISRSFKDKTEAFNDKEVISSKCFLCHRNLRKTVKWFTPNAKNYYCVAYCEKHGYLRAKMRIRKTDNDRVYVVKTTKFIAEDDVNRLLERKAKAKELKKRKRQETKKKNNRD